MPAYNAEKTLKDVLRSIPPNFTNLLLVDDVSKDNTVSLSKELGIRTIVHKVNKGYGGNQKTCYEEALKDGADIVVMLHPDGQYDPGYIPKLIEPIVDGSSEAVFGSRMATLGGARYGGMPVWKRIANKFLSTSANFLTDSNFTEWHCGFRAYSKKCLESVDFKLNSNGYDFDIDMTLRLLKKNVKIVEIPIPTHYDNDASSINFYSSTIYGLRFLRRIIEYKLGKFPRKI